LLEDLRNTYLSNASNKGLPINVHLDPALSPALMIDADRLRQILNNLVSNAVKFTDAGRIDIRAELVAREQSRERVRFCVTDTGIGVSLEQQAKLFKPFAQAEIDTARRYGGTGLGLSISMRLAELMAGSLTMQSELGQGTTMSLEAVFETADPALLSTPEIPTGVRVGSRYGERAISAPTVAQAEASGRLVLLVDDHPTNRLLLGRQVNLLGYAVETANDGVEALKLWESRRFGLVLTDCNMPHMDGYELTRAIRALEAAGRSGPRCPVIACTANALRGEAAVCLEAGMDDYITKPVELKDLLAMLQRWLPLPATSIPQPNPEAPAAMPQEARLAHGATPVSPIDHHALAEMTSGNTELEHAIFAEFQRASEGDMARLSEALSSRGLTATKSVVHLLKGASAMIGAVALADACRNAELTAQSGDWTGIERDIARMQAEVHRLNQYFAARQETEGATQIPLQKRSALQGQELSGTTSITENHQVSAASSYKRRSGD
ncbi:MAG: response regulator, partial [Pseudomonadota bacterium]|nr:response regulator [Pseudomonadota bacterium]